MTTSPLPPTVPLDPVSRGPKEYAKQVAASTAS
jgi:hypothetical protein